MNECLGLDGLRMAGSRCLGDRGVGKRHDCVVVAKKYVVDVVEGILNNWCNV